MKKVLAPLAALLMLAFAGPALADEELTLQPESFGSHTVSSWRAQEGLPDSFGNARQALYMQKAAEGPPGVAWAVVRGIEGVPVRFLTGLSYEYRVDSQCTDRDPRWTLRVRVRGGATPIARFGCRAGVQTLGSAPGWIRTTHPQAAIEAMLMRVGGRAALAGTVVDLALTFNPQVEVGYAMLDNVTVQVRRRVRVFTSAADNGDQASPSPSSFGETFAADQALPFSSNELLTVEDLLMSLTEEEQAVVAMTPDELDAYLDAPDEQVSP